MKYGSTNPTPYFLDLLALLSVLARASGCLEKYGSPDWTKPENIVTNGAYRLVTRRIRDRIRLERSDELLGPRERASKM